MHKIKDPFSWIEAAEEKRLGYKETKEARNPELWISSKYDFKDPAVWEKYVEAERCSVAGCASALIKNWVAVKRHNSGKERRKEDETISDIMVRINRIQRNLGMGMYRFQELEDIGYYEELAEDDARQNQGYNDEYIVTTEEGDNELITSSEEEAELQREELQEEAEARGDEDW